MRLRFTAALSVALVLLSTTSPIAARAKALVLHSTGPSASRYPPGLVLSEPLQIKLKRGDRVRILDAKGTRELKGPATIGAGEPRTLPKHSSPSWDDLVGSKLRTDAAGVREVPSEPRRGGQLQAKTTSQSQLWQIDPLIGGTWCVVDVRAIEFWRENPSEEVELAITPSDGKPVHAAWRKDRSVLPWPTTLPATDMARYTMQLGPGPTVSMTLRQIAIGTSLDGLTRALSLNGCKQQQGILSRP